MRRRAFIGGVGAAALVGPRGAWGQQGAMPVIGLLSPGSAETFADRVRAFRHGLNENGYVEGRNVAIDFRWTEGRYDSLPSLAAELVRSQVAVIVTLGGTASAIAAKAATSTIPIVIQLGFDPVETGLVSSLSRPGGN